MKRILVFTVLVLLFATNSTSAQTVSGTSGIQDSLSELSSKIWKQKSDSNRLQSNYVFFKKFQSFLEKSSSFGIPLDSINGITRVASDDGKFRIFTWNVPISDGSNRYFGFIQFRRDSLKVIPLKSNEKDWDDFNTRQLTPENWYGAIYYKLIEVEINKQKAYTLLGWDGYTANSNRKLIDIITLDNNGNVAFGMPVFKTEKGIKTRVVIEYAEKASMLLRYDYQSVLVEKKKKIRKEDAWIIVMDRMVPMDPSMEGFRKYYVPTGNTYDGYIFKNGFWTLVENIEVANKSILLRK